MTAESAVALFHSNINLAFLLLIFYSTNLKAEIYEVYIYIYVYTYVSSNG